MKKILAIVIGIALAWWLAPSSLVVQAASEVDQVCDVQDIEDPEDVGYWRIKTHDEIGQTFKPEVDKLTSLIIAVGGEVGARISLSIIDISTGSTVASRMEVAEYSQAHWLEYQFEPTVTLDTSKNYKIKATTAYDDVYWYVATIPCYANGDAIVDGTTRSTQDFGFTTYGYDSTPPASPPADEPKEEESEASEKSEESSNEIAEEDESVNEPTMTKVEVNGSEIEISDSTIEVTEGDKILISGTVEKGNEVVVIWGLKTYKATVSGDGTWSVEIITDESSEEEILVQGQAKKEDKGSDKVDFFTVMVAEAKAEVVSQAPDPGSKNSNMMVYVYLGLAAIIAAVSGIGGYYYYKNKNRSAGKLGARPKKEKKTK